VSAVSAFIPVFEAASRLPRLIGRLRELCDEVVVIVDERSKDGSDAVAHELADHVFAFAHDEDFATIFEEMMRRCHGDWVLRFDDDETPAPEWTRARVREMAEAPSVTHYHFPRRWIVPPGDRFCCQPPHWPNWATRMMQRRRDRIVRPKGLVHPALSIAGFGRFVADLAIDHWNFVVYDRAARESKVAAYERAAAGAGLPHWYLYEDYDYQTEVVKPPVAMRGPAGPFRSASPYCTDVRVLDLPSLIVAAKPYVAEIEIVNRSTRDIRAVPPDWVSQPNRFASHWTSSDKTVSVFESKRTMVSMPIPAGAAERALIRIDAPPRPGQYWLRADIVEEFVAWYSAAPGAGYHEPRLVDVVPAPA
jgi:glycosyltransferase involved in cell wall biosynthesis